MSRPTRNLSGLFLTKGGVPWPFFLAFLLYTISIYTSLGTRLSFLEAIRHEFIIGVFLIIVSIWTAMATPLQLEKQRLIVFATVLFFATMVSQVLFAIAPQHSWDFFVERVLKQSMFALFLAALIRTPHHLKWFMAAFLFSHFWIYQESVRGLITGELYWYNQGIQRLHGAVLLYRMPNGLSFAAITSLPFIIHLFPVVKIRSYRFALCGTAVLSLLCVLFTGSRAGYVSAIALVLGWWFQSRRKLPGISFGLVFVILLLTVFPNQYKERFSTIGHQEETDHSREERIGLLLDAWDIFQEHPLGVGLDGFIVANSNRPGRHILPERDLRTHNLFLQTATNLGILGLFSLSFLVGALFWSFFSIVTFSKRYKRQLSRCRSLSNSKLSHKKMSILFEHATFLGAAANSVILYLFVLLIDGLFAHILFKISWWLLCGLAIGMNNAKTNLTKNLLTLSEEHDS